jgi:hypothetical protein
MLRSILFAAVVASSTMACAFDPYRAHRPARLLLGTNARDLAGSDDRIAARTASPTAAEAVAHSAQTVSAQFTMATTHRLYGGFELEAGRLDSRGSNFAGAYAVVGAEHAWSAGSIGAELVGGWRALRDGLEADDVSSLVAEPRVRGQLQVSPQLTLGAVVGSTFAERGSWLAGLYLGVHSDVFGD